MVIYVGSNCSSGTVVFDFSISGAGTPYSLTVPGLGAGSYSVTDGITPADCVNFTVISASIPEYPYGLSLLAILTIIAYGVIRRSPKLPTKSLNKLDQERKARKLESIPEAVRAVLGEYFKTKAASNSHLQ